MSAGRRAAAPEGHLLAEIRSLNGDPIVQGAFFAYRSCTDKPPVLDRRSLLHFLVTSMQKLLIAATFGFCFLAHAQDQGMVSVPLQPAWQTPKLGTVDLEPKIATAPASPVVAPGMTPGLPPLPTAQTPGLPTAASPEAGMAPGTPVPVYRTMAEAQEAGVAPLHLPAPTTATSSAPPSVEVAPLQEQFVQWTANQALKLGIPVWVLWGATIVGLCLVLRMFYRAAFPRPVTLPTED